MKKRPPYFQRLLPGLFAAVLLTGCPGPEPNELPTCEINSPKDGSVFTPDDVINLQFTAWDTDGEITAAEVYLNQYLITTLDNSQNQYSIGLAEYNTGEYLLKVIVRDDGGGEVIELVDLTIILALDTFTDPRDGHIYRIVKIGNQTWMADNLAYLPSVDPIDQLSATEPRFYVLNYSGMNVQEAMEQEAYARQGALYNWQAALIAAPEGWHVPSHSEWMALEAFIASENEECELTEAEGFDTEDGTCFIFRSWACMTSYLSHTSGWSCEANGRNTYGFSLCPCYPNMGYKIDPSKCQKEGSWWTSTQADYDENEIWIRQIVSPDPNFRSNQLNPKTGVSLRFIKPGYEGMESLIHMGIPSNDNFISSQMNPGAGLSIRCIKND